MRTFALLPFAAAVAAIVLPGCPSPCDGCYADDGPPGPSTTTQCVEATAPTTGAPTLVLGDGSGSTFAPFSGKAGRQLDYGDQGGQHFYVTVRWYGAPTDGVLVLSYDGSTGNHGSQTVFNEPGCTGWLEASTYVQLDQAVDESGTLHATAGRCAASGCAYDELTDQYVLEEILTEADQSLALTP